MTSDGHSTNPFSVGRADHRRRIYGRNVGIRLRPSQKRLVETLLPEIRYQLEPGTKIEPRALFSDKSEIWLEVGFGGGEHLAELAQRRPDVGFIGVEPFFGGVAKLLSKIQQSDLTNVRVIIDDARLVLDQLADNSVARVFILFPDPWPKKRHHKRRIVNAETVRDLAQVMKDNAELRMATDDRDYARSMLETMLAAPTFEWPASEADDWRQRPLDWAPTRYEQKGLDAGRPPMFLRFRRRPR